MSSTNFGIPASNLTSDTGIVWQTLHNQSLALLGQASTLSRLVEHVVKNSEGPSKLPSAFSTAKPTATGFGSFGLGSSSQKDLPAFSSAPSGSFFSSLSTPKPPPSPSNPVPQANSPKPSLDGSSAPKPATSKPT